MSKHKEEQSAENRDFKITDYFKEEAYVETI